MTVMLFVKGGSRELYNNYDVSFPVCVQAEYMYTVCSM